MNIVSKAKEIDVIPQNANTFKSKVILKTVLSQFDVVGADKAKLFRLISVLVGKSFLQVKYLYETEFEQFSRLFYKVKREIEDL